MSCSTPRNAGNFDVRHGGAASVRVGAGAHARGGGRLPRRAWSDLQMHAEHCAHAPRAKARATWRPPKTRHQSRAADSSLPVRLSPLLPLALHRHSSSAHLRDPDPASSTLPPSSLLPPSCGDDPKEPLPKALARQTARKRIGTP